MSDLKQQIRQFVITNFLFGEDKGLSDGASFLENSVVDSTGVLELVAFIEKEFGIKVRDNELVPENLDSIDAVANYITRKRTASI